MSGFVANLVGRSFGLVPVVQPRLASRFEPAAEAHQSPVEETFESENPIRNIRRQTPVPDVGRVQAGPDGYADRTDLAMRKEGPAGDVSALSGTVDRQAPPSADIRPSGEHRVPPIRRIEVADRSPVRSDGPVAVSSTHIEPGTDRTDAASTMPDEPRVTTESLVGPHVPVSQPVSIGPADHPVTHDVSPQRHGDPPSVVGLSEAARDEVRPASLSVASPSVTVSPEPSLSHTSAEPVVGADAAGPLTAGAAVGAIAQPTSSDAERPTVQDRAEAGHVLSPAVVHTPAPDSDSERRTEIADLIRPAGPGMLPVSSETSRRPAQRTADPAPTIRVTIGRIEVHAETETPPPTRRTARPSPKISLDDYLRSQDRRQR